MYDTGVDESQTAASTEESEVSQIDVVGPQTLTAGSNYPLLLREGVSYKEANFNGSTPELDVEPIVDGGLLFKPKAEAELGRVRVR